MAVLDQCLHMISTMFRVIHKLACSAIEQISSRYGDQEQTLRPRVYYVKHRPRVNSIHRNCVGSGGIGGTGSACRGRWTFRRSLCCTRCSCSACIAVMICSCCAMKSEVLGLIRRMRMIVSPSERSFCSFFSFFRSLMVPRLR